MKRTTLFALTLAAAFGMAQAGAFARQQQEEPKPPTPEERQELRTIYQIESASARVEALKKFIAAHPNSALVPSAKRSLFGALADAKAPIAEVVAAGDAMLASVPEPARGPLFNMYAMALAERGEQLDKALELANKALADVPAEDKETRAGVQDTVGWVYLKRGEYAKAIENISAAAAVSGDNQEVLYHLGLAYEKAGKPDQAVDAYIKSSTVFLGQDTSAEAPLRALYEKQNGSLKGLDERLAAAREASRKYVTFESRKWDKPAPAWDLKDLAGKPVRMADFKGKVVVMDFWGSWCPPCRDELPKFQALYEKYKDNKNVVFLGMDWERGESSEEKMKAVTEFIAKNQYTFPVVIDHDRVAVESYEIQGFPTVYLIDPQGQIRYRNLGYEEGVEQIIEAQLQSLMK